MESAVLRQRNDRIDRSSFGHHHDDRTEEDGNQRGSRSWQQRRGGENSSRANRGPRGKRGKDQHLESAFPTENLDLVYCGIYKTHRYVHTPTPSYSDFDRRRNLKCSPGMDVNVTVKRVRRDPSPTFLCNIFENKSNKFLRKIFPHLRLYRI